MPRFLVDPNEKGVRIIGQSVLKRCSMFERMEWNHPIIIFFDIKTVNTKGTPGYWVTTHGLRCEG